MGKEIERAEAFTRELAGLYGDALVSVVLYGSAARGEYREGVSDLNLLVLLREVSPAALRRGSAAARRWAQQGNPPPMVLPEQEWRRSADVFPIELADMRDAHRVLAGADPFVGVEIDASHLRHQCEAELKGKQIQLREGYLLSAAKPAELGELLVQALSTFLVLFRTVLRLADGSSPREPEAVVSATAAHAGFDPAPLLEVLRARRAGGRLKPAADSPLVEGYLEAVAKVVEYVDTHAAGQA